MIINKQNICDPFTILKTEKQNIGIITFRITNRVTNEKETLSIDVYAELLSFSVSPHRKFVLLNLLANKGFHVSPIPDALESFFHLLLFPQDAITPLGNVPVEDLPNGEKVEVISTCGDDS